MKGYRPLHKGHSRRKMGAKAPAGPEESARQPPSGSSAGRPEDGEEVDYMCLRGRLGDDLLRLRLLRQAEHVADKSHQAWFDRFLPPDPVIAALFKACGLFWWGKANLRKIRVEENTFFLPHLPEAFEGYRILHLSDLHIDVDEKLAGAVAAKVQGLEYDLAVFTGDFRNTTDKDYYPALRLMREVAAAVHGPKLAVLGNHDFVEMVPALERMGLRVLLNEGFAVERGEEVLYFSGIDDNSYYKTYSLAAATRERPVGAVSGLLAHAPELFREAANSNFDFYLCGHTHAGQICLPGGFAPVKNSEAPVRYHAGVWQHGKLQGYTSRGTGACGVPLRFFCPPEITVHTLRRG